VLVCLVFLFVSFFFASPVWAGYSLTVSDLPEQVDSQQVFSLSASFSGETSYYKKKRTHYLRAAFSLPGTYKYFGCILNQAGNWACRPSSDGIDLFSFTTSPQGTWSGQLQVVADLSGDKSLTSGEYSFKLGRYTSGQGGSANWTEPLSLVINFPTVTSTSTPTDTPTTSTATPTDTVTSTPTVTSSPTVLQFAPSATLSATPSSFLSQLGAIFLGVSSSSPSSGSVLSASSTRLEDLIPPLAVFGGGLCIFSFSLFLARPEFFRQKR